MMSRDGGVIGVSDHGGWAVLVTAAGDGRLLNRCRVELVDENLPKIPASQRRARASRSMRRWNWWSA